MSNFDIGDLEISAEPVEIQPDEYVAPDNKLADPIPAKTYPVQFVDGKFKSEGSGKTGCIRPGTQKSKKNGESYLQAEFAVKVTDGLGEKNALGRFVYGRVSTMPEKLIFNEVKEGRENANSFLDLLMAVGYTGKLAGSQDYVNALASVVEDGTAARARIDWEAYSNPNSTEYPGTGETIRGMKNFPLNADGTPSPRIKDQAGNTILARNVIKAVYAPKKV